MTAWRSPAPKCSPARSPGVRDARQHRPAPAPPGRSRPGDHRPPRGHCPGRRQLVLGDSYAVCRSGGSDTVLTDDRLDRLDLPQSRRYRQRLAAGSGYDAAHAAILRELQAAQRARRNTPGGYWIASANPAAAAHAVTRTFPAASLEWIVLATGGAAGTARHLGLGDWDAIARSGQAGLSAMLQRCHDWEEDTDPDGRQLPRAKRHDDKTVAAILLP